MSRTATAPVDRVKLLLQVQDVGPALTIRDGFRHMVAEGTYPDPSCAEKLSLPLHGEALFCLS